MTDTAVIEIEVFTNKAFEGADIYTYDTYAYTIEEIIQEIKDLVPHYKKIIVVGWEETLNLLLNRNIRLFSNNTSKIILYTPKFQLF